MEKKRLWHGAVLMGAFSLVLVLSACGKPRQPTGASAGPQEPLLSELQNAPTSAATAIVPSQAEEGAGAAGGRQSGQTPEPAGGQGAGTRTPTATEAPEAVRQPHGAGGESGLATVFRSSKPLYVKLAPGAGRSEILPLALDESKGTGQGYDRLYADLNHNGSFEQTEALEATTPGENGLVASSFRVHLGPGRGSAVVHYSKQGSTERFLISGDIALNQGGVAWKYSLVGQVKPSSSLSAAPVWGLSGAPKLGITTKPDLEKKGNLGIALGLAVGETQVVCTGGGKSPEAHVVIKDAAGRIVHQDTSTAEKFTFG